MSSYYALTRDGTLATLMWRTNLPLIRESVEAANRELVRMERGVSVDCVIVELELRVVGLANLPAAKPAKE